MKKMLRHLSLAVTAVSVLLLPGAALAECSITGNIEAEMIDDSMLPSYKYTMTVSWDMDSPHGLSHLDLIMDMQGGTCDCSDFYDALYFEMYSGTSDGEYDCTVNYYAEINCQGDPSIPDLYGIVLKFEPYEDDGCEPGPMGTGTFVFYSDLAPVPVDSEYIALVDKAALEYCTGSITGVFPGMACDPVPTLERSMDSLKSLYR